MARGRPRSSETREATNRAADSRPVPKTTHTSRFYIPPNVIPKGMTYAWVAVAFDNAGTPNADNWRNKYRSGWRPVPRDRHPELFPAVPNIGFGEDTDDLIKEGGQILCEKPTSDVLAARAENDKKARQQVEGVNWAQGPNMNPFAQTMPRVDLGSTPVEFGHSAEFKD
jgi:hypothetical protein